MVHSPAPGIGQQINPNQIIRVEMSRSVTAECVQVRVFVTNAKEPHVFEFESMASAIGFYERLWSLRTVDDDEAVASSVARRL